MAIFRSDSVRNSAANAISDTWGSNPKLRLYSGTIPANEAAALSSQALLWEAIMTPAAAVGGLKNMLGSTLIATGLVTAGEGLDATFYRVYASDGVTCHEQGTITITGGGGDLELDNPNIAYNQTVSIGTLTVNIPG